MIYGNTLFCLPFIFKEVYYGIVMIKLVLTNACLLNPVHHTLFGYLSIVPQL